MTERFTSTIGRFALACLAALLIASSAAPIAPTLGLGSPGAEAATAAKKSARKSTRAKRQAVPPRPPVRVDPAERRKSAAEGKIRRGSSTPPRPYSGTSVRPRVEEWDFGPGTIVQRRDQLKPPQPRPPLLHPPRPPRGYDPIPGPGHGPGTYITPIYPGTIGPTGN